MDMRDDAMEYQCKVGALLLLLLLLPLLLLALQLLALLQRVRQQQ
jgi:hypothetical protein